MSYFGTIQQKDQYGFVVENTPLDEMRVVTPFRLVGSTFVGTTIDTNFWTPSSASGATVAPTQGNGEVTVSTLTTANGTCNIQSVRLARYVSGSSNRFRAVVQLSDTGNADNVRRWGAFSSSGGAFFELNGTTVNICTAKTNLTDTAAALGDQGVYRVASASWNGSTTVPTLTNANTYEIYWTNKSVYFIINGTLMHTVSATGNTWSETISLPVRIESTNSNGSTVARSVRCRTAAISRLGKGQTQTMYKYQSGTTAGVICKIGPGILRSMTVGTPVSGSVITIYDGTTTGGAVIHSFTWTAGAQSNNQPFTITFDNIAFFTGLFLVIATQNANVTIVYE